MLARPSRLFILLSKKIMMLCKKIIFEPNPLSSVNLCMRGISGRAVADLVAPGGTRSSHRHFLILSISPHSVEAAARLVN